MKHKKDAPKASFLRITLNMNNSEKSLEYTDSSVLPKDLFSRIGKRLGLEKELSLIKRHLKFFFVLLVIFVFLSIFAFIGLKTVLEESNFLPFLSLIFSDPGMVLKYWESFLLSISESIPGFAFAGFIFTLAFVMLFIRFIVFSIAKISSVLKLISKQRYGTK